MQRKYEKKFIHTFFWVFLRKLYISGLGKPCWNCFKIWGKFKKLLLSRFFYQIVTTLLILKLGISLDILQIQISKANNVKARELWARCSLYFVCKAVKHCTAQVTDFNYFKVKMCHHFGSGKVQTIICSAQ